MGGGGAAEAVVFKWVDVANEVSRAFPQMSGSWPQRLTYRTCPEVRVHY